MVKRRKTSVVAPTRRSRRTTRKSKIDSTQDDVVIRPFDKPRIKLLMSRGASYPDLPIRSSISVSDLLVRIDQQSPNMPKRIISPVKQLKALNAIVANPLRGSYVLAISSFPSDLRARYLAAMLMSLAIDKHRTMRTSKGLPVWHHVYGGAGDPFRDKPLPEAPSMLILSNVNANSSQTKLEKIRDLLEKFSNIPRIVVLGGPDPCSLFSNYLYYPLKVGIYLGVGSKTSQI